jgi:DNA-directed RNA polymerase sigma subunit (sigma70/sigma32)
MNKPMDNLEMTQKEVGEVLGMDRSNVSDCERRALEKLRVALEKRGIKASDFLEVK